MLLVVTNGNGYMSPNTLPNIPKGWLLRQSQNLHLKDNDMIVKER